MLRVCPVLPPLGLSIIIGALSLPLGTHAQNAPPAVPAHPADAFVESVGVNVHLGYTDTKYTSHFSEIAEKLDALGIRYVRSRIQDPAGWKAPLMLELYDKTGIQMVAVTANRDGGYPNPLDLDPATLDSVLDVAEEHYVTDTRQAIAAFEGPNEYDLSHGPDDDWVETLRTYQQLLYDAIQERPKLNDLPVLAPSIAFHEKKAGSFATMADHANMHPYPGGRAPPSGLTNNLNTAAKAVGEDAPVTATETGYHTATGNAKDGDGYISQPGVPEEVQARYTPRLFMEYFRRGIDRTYVYEFIDLFPDPDNDHQEHNFGLLRNDLSEKPAYKALQATLALLADPGSSPSHSPDSLRYTLSGPTENVRQVLFQKQNGRFFLVLWQSVQSYQIPNEWRSGAQGTVLRPDPAAVTLTLQRHVAEGYVYQPLNAGTDPMRALKGGMRFSLEVPDHLMIVELRLDDK